MTTDPGHQKRFQCLFKTLHINETNTSRSRGRILIDSKFAKIIVLFCNYLRDLTSSLAKGQYYLLSSWMCFSQEFGFWA